MPPVRRRRLLPSLVVAAALLFSVASSPVLARGPDRADDRSSLPVRAELVKGKQPLSEPRPVETGRLIVRYRAGTSPVSRAAARSAIGARLVGPVALPDAELIEPPAGADRALMSLAKRPEVASVHVEYRRTLAAGPTDEPLFGQQWALHNTGQVINGIAGEPGVDLNVPEAWKVTTGKKEIVVAVIDDGVDLSHPDLAARAWVNSDEVPDNGLDDDANGFVDDVNGWDFCNGDNTVHDADDEHGTHVAGSIAASGNDVGVAGIAPKVRIMALKFIHGTNAGACGSDSQAIAAIQYAVANGADLINASWGGYGFSQPLRDAFAAASSVMVSAAAGNDNINNDVFPVYPASFDLPNILSVASIHRLGHLTASTNYGPSTVDLSAPGHDILSTLPGGSYGYGNGTSMAAANASGVAALALSAHPELLGSGADLRAHLIRTARALPSTHFWVAFPGLLDARGAVVGRPDVKRLAGADRYATSVAISRASFVPFVPLLFVATGENFPDALAGGAMAAQTGSPLLLVKRTSIPSVVLKEIERLRPYHIIVLGGTGAVADSVLATLQAYDDDDAEDPPFDGPFRVAGADRYATAAKVPGQMQTLLPGLFPNGWGGTVFIANGGNFPDALAGGAASGLLGGPVLLTTTTSIPSATKAELGRLDPSRIVILGGKSVVSSSVAQQLKGYAPKVVRWSGADRYATAAVTSEKAFAVSGDAFLAAGTTFPDALSGDAAAGAYGGPMLLTTRTTLPAATVAELQRIDPVRIFVLGGTSVVAGSVVDQVKGLFP